MNQPNSKNNCKHKLFDEHECEEEEIKVSVVFSPDEEKKYRFYLKREWDSSKQNIAFIMLNPSRADALRSDNSVNNATNYAVSNGFGSVTIVNLFADRGTDKGCLVKRDKSTDKINDSYIAKALEESTEFVVAWVRGDYKIRKKAVTKILKLAPAKLRCFAMYDKKKKTLIRKVNHLRVFSKDWKYETWNPTDDLMNELYGHK